MDTNAIIASERKRDEFQQAYYEALERIERLEAKLAECQRQRDGLREVLKAAPPTDKVGSFEYSKWYTKERRAALASVQDDEFPE